MSPSIRDRDTLDAAFLSAAQRRDASRCNIVGLWPDLSTAATVLRFAKSLGELDAADCDDDKALDRFFDLLQEVEERIRRMVAGLDEDSNTVDSSPGAGFVIAVEGLDGSGKSTLVRRVAEGLKSSTHKLVPEYVHACATPSASLAAVRPAFDRRGGPVARAFYMCSNYVLQHEIRKACKALWEEERKEKTSSNSKSKVVPVFIVDRFYSSTCAYTVGWKNTSGSPAESINNLPDSLFAWPHDLRPPDLMLILQVNDEVRRNRVSSRAEGAATARSSGDPNSNDSSCIEGAPPPPAMSRHNPWDERLSNDEELGQRIVAAHRRTIGPSHVEEVDANGSPDDISRMALEIIRNRLLGEKIPSVVGQKKVTVALTGTHCSGKNTLGRLLAGYLGWRFDPELGDILRDRDALVVDGHRTGDGSGVGGGGTNKKECWDDRVHREECARDRTCSRSCSRVVETWHIGNLAWALQRRGRSNNNASEEENIARVRAQAQRAIRDEMERGDIVMVHLQTSPETTVRRRNKQPENVLRLPMSDEECESRRLHTALDVHGVQLLHDFEGELKFPILILSNNDDGGEAMGDKIRQIEKYLARYIHK